jgi:hypothetical protein
MAVGSPVRRLEREGDGLNHQISRQPSLGQSRMQRGRAMRCHALYQSLTADFYEAER